MGLSAADYFNELAALLPQGPAWAIDEPSTLTLFLDAWSQEFARVQARAEALGEEADPRTTYELLPDYEALFGLPTACMSGIAQSVQQRRQALQAQMISGGGQSIAYYIALALAAGFVITITEFRPWTVGMTIDLPLYGSDWAYAWQVNAPLNTISYFTMSSAVDEALAMWGNNLLECIINRFKPAHTVVLFAYS